MALTNFDDTPTGEKPDLENLELEEPSSGGGGNRSFLIAIAILAVIFIASLILLLLVGPSIIRRQREQAAQQAAEIVAQNTMTALAATSMFEQAQTQSVTETPVPTLAPTNTPLVVVKTTTPVPTTSFEINETATVSALQTQMAALGGAGTPGVTPTALPTTGFADEVGLPGLVGMAAVLVVIIVLARRLRLSPR